MASENESISQSHGNVLQITKPSDRRIQISNECYMRCMILLVLLLLHSTREDRITIVKHGAERSENTLTAKLPKTQHSPLGHRVASGDPGIESHDSSTTCTSLSAKDGNQKRQEVPFKQYRLPLGNLVDSNQIMTKLQGFKETEAGPS